MDAALRRKFDAQFAAARSLDPDMVIPVNERYKFTVEDAGKGDFIRYDGKTWLVQEMGVYKESNEKFTKTSGDPWTELKLLCLETGEAANIEWEKDDELEVHFTVKEIRFKDLTDDEKGAIDEDDLDDLAEEEDSIFFEGAEYEYDDDYPALYFRSGSESNKEKVYFYEFLSKAGTGITIEEWDSGSGREEYNLYLSRKVDPESFELTVRGRQA